MLSDPRFFKEWRKNEKFVNDALKLDEDMIKSLKYGVGLAIGVDHKAYTVSIDPLQVDVRNNLVKDLI